MKITFLSIIVLALGLVPIQAQQKWEIKHVVEVESATALAFSPDASKIVWVKRSPNSEKDNFSSHLYLTYLDKKEKDGFVSVALTQGETSNYSPLFSKDGKKLYFLSSREKKNTLWAFNLLGGEPEAVHTFPNSISSLTWLDEYHLLFLSEEGESLVELEAKKKKDNVIAVEDTTMMKPVRVFSFSLSDKTVTRLTENPKEIYSFAVSKDAKWLVTAQVMSPHYGSDGKPKPTYHLYNLKDKTHQQILKDGFQTPSSFSFSRDSKTLFFTAETSSDPEWQGAGISELYEMNLTDFAIQKVNIAHDWGLGYGGFDVFGNGLLVNLAKGATNDLVYLEKDKKGNWSKKMVDAGSMNGRVRIGALAENQKNVAFVYSTASTPTQYKVGEISISRKNATLEKVSTLIELNDFYKKLTIAKSEIIRWKGALGEEIEGVLYYPHDYKPGRAYPLIVAPHGGPSAADLDAWSERWAYYPNLFAQRGAFTLKPNYHGSSNYGQTFVESIKKRYYELELEDIITGIDYLAEKGMVTKDSLAMMGWSNGAILSTMISVKYPDLFKVISAGAGDVNWTSDYGTCAFGVTFDQSYFGGAPWDDVNGKTYNENYILKSPLFELEKVKTPTIIFHGSEDRAVPRDQGWEYYRALQQVGQAPVRFLWFPGQGHGLAKLSHQKRKMEEELKWFDTYLFGTYKSENEAFKKESPLATVFERSKIAQVKGIYGVMENDVLIPETVSLGKDTISVGRFEITNAQFAAFKPEFSFNSIDANKPATGFSWDDALAYTQWLSEKTGKTYRLPNAKEASSFHKKAVKNGKKENTLNYWAGYDITRDDARKLVEKAREAGVKLLNDVGKFSPIKLGGHEVFDLAGSLREMTSERGKTYGFSALDFVDEANPEVSGWLNGFTGFRVILESKK
jgi:dipeptidyl aminopeptidase/acylaminoacyl peptidase